MGIEPPKIPSRRDRITVSPERREEARAGMGGEQTKVAGASAPAAVVAPAPVEETPAAPAQPAAPAAVAPAPTPEPVPAPELPAAPAAAAAPAPEPTPAPEPVAAAPELPAAPAPDLATTPTAESAPALAAAVVKPVKPVAAAGAKRGRGRPPLETERMGPQRPVKIPEDVWEDIRLSLVQFPKGEDLPRNIKAYLVAAHRVYDAQLRKQGKLPPSKETGKVA